MIEKHGLKTSQIGLNPSKLKKDWTSALENLRKCFKHEIDINFDNLGKKEVIERLGKKFSLYGSPSEDLLYETDYKSN